MSSEKLVPILKADDELQVVWGWASVVEKNGVPVIDEQGDTISELELTKAFHEFMSASRKGGFMHAKGDDGKAIQVGEIVGGMVFSKALQTAMGIDLGFVGAMIAYHIPDPGIWAEVRKGNLAAFSIGGSGVRTEVEIDA